MPTITDPDANERYAPHPGTHDKSEFEGESNPPQSNNVDNSHGSQNRNGKNKPKDNNQSASNPADSNELKNKEESPPDRSDFSAADDMRERLGMGYTGEGSTKSKKLSKLYNSKSAFKKKIAIAGAAAGASVLLGIIIFLAMLPLKIIHIVDNLESKFMATSQEALSKEVDNLYSSYITKNVLPVLHAHNCHTTIDAGCIALKSGSNSPFSRLFNGWKDAKLEHKMATKYGIVIGAKGTSSNKYYMTVNGKNFDFNGGQSIFDVGGPTNRNDVRRTVNKALKDGTLWDKTYTRYKVGKLLERKYGIKRCVIACNAKDKFTDKIADKKLAAKAYLVQRLVPQKYGLILQCVIGDVSNCDPKNLSASPGDDEKLSSFDRNLRTELNKYSAEFGKDSLDKLVKNATIVSEKGFTKMITRSLAEKIAGKFGGDTTAALAGDFSEKAVPVVGWISAIAGVIAISSEIGPLVTYGSYALNSATAIETYNSFSTVASEVQSGHMDATELGSFTQTLTTNLSGSVNDQADATESPVYNYYFGGGKSTNTASIFSSLLPGTASADSSYLSHACNPTTDGGPRTALPKNDLICPEEKLAQHNAALDTISKISNIPLVTPTAQAIHSVTSSISGVIGEVPGIKQLGELVAEPLGNAMNWITGKLITSPFSEDMSGARTFDMMAAGADKLGSDSCQSLGCPQASNQLVASIRNQQSSDQKADFDHQPLFARIFSTTTPYSLVSRLAMSMPPSIIGITTSGAAGLLDNPLNKITSSFASIFSTSRAFADETARSDPWGIPQSAYTDSQIPPDPEQFWQDNCVSGPIGLSNSAADNPLSTLDVSPWLNNDEDYILQDGSSRHVDFTQGTGPNVVPDSATGQPVYLKPNQCLLIQSTAQSSGAMFGVAQS
ncbi:MAG: hypothetical protein ABI220_00525 [Candidatus Saccharimonadales bacterium]